MKDRISNKPGLTLAEVRANQETIGYRLRKKVEERQQRERRSRLTVLERVSALMERNSVGSQQKVNKPEEQIEWF